MEKLDILKIRRESVIVSGITLFLVQALIFRDYPALEIPLLIIIIGLLMKEE